MVVALIRFSLMLDEQTRQAEIVQFRQDYTIFIALEKVEQQWAEEMVRRSLFQRSASLFIQPRVERYRLEKLPHLLPDLHNFTY